MLGQGKQNILLLWNSLVSGVGLCSLHGPTATVFSRIRWDVVVVNCYCVTYIKTLIYLLVPTVMTNV